MWSDLSRLVDVECKNDLLFHLPFLRSEVSADLVQTMEYNSVSHFN